MENLGKGGDYPRDYEGFSSEEERSSGPYQGREEVYSKVVRAGKRTYFFDVKSTRGGELYPNITESRKRVNKDNQLHFEKHTLFLYKEDFEKFLSGLTEVLDFIQEGNVPEYPEEIDGEN